MSTKTKAVVIFSGGQDSTTCLGWALKNYDKVEAITFNYGQKHSVEIEQSKIICEKHKVKQTIIDISFLNTIVDSALLSNGQDVNDNHKSDKNLPASFVPNRNQLFITLAHAYAQKIKADSIVIGVCETDYSGYYDCRQDFIDIIEMATNIGAYGVTKLDKEGDYKINKFIKIDAPLMHLDKAHIFQMSKNMGVLEDVLLHSHTCYNGIRSKFNEWGFGCGECNACKLRKSGFEKFKQLS